MAEFTRGEAHGNSRLTDDEVWAIRTLRREGLTLQALADKFEISNSYASKLCRAVAR